MDIISPKFDNGVGVAVGVDFWFYTALPSPFYSETFRMRRSLIQNGAVCTGVFGL
jgi:hypothetical protein